MEESPAASDPLAERRGAVLTLALSQNSNASSMVSSAVCFSVDPTPIVESIVHHHQHHIQPCSSISRGRHLRISNRTSSTERNCHVTSLSLRIIFNHVRGASLHVSEHLSLLWMCFKRDFSWSTTVMRPPEKMTIDLKSVVRRCPKKISHDHFHARDQCFTRSVHYSRHRKTIYLIYFGD